MFRSQLVSNKNKMSIEQKRGITGNGIEIAGGMKSVYISPYLKMGRCKAVGVAYL
jgi:hypothetical protein